MHLELLSAATAKRGSLTLEILAGAKADGVQQFAGRLIDRRDPQNAQCAHVQRNKPSCTLRTAELSAAAAETINFKACQKST